MKSECVQGHRETLVFPYLQMFPPHCSTCRYSERVEGSAREDSVRPGGSKDLGQGIQRGLKALPEVTVSGPRGPGTRASDILTRQASFCTTSLLVGMESDSRVTSVLCLGQVISLMRRYCVPPH